MTETETKNLEKAASTLFAHRVLNLIIHAAHAAWIVALIGSVDKSGVISNYSLFPPILVLATFLEMCRWVLLGAQSIETKGPYSHASAIDAANREFLLFSWYVIPAIPPFSLLERYAAGIHNFPVRADRGQIFAKFWLKSEVTLPLIGCLVLIPTLYSSTPPSLWGLGKYFPVSCLFWIVEFGFFSKILALLFYVTGIRIFKGL